MIFIFPEFGLYPLDYKSHLSDYKVVKKVKRVPKLYKPTIQKSIVVKRLTRRLMPSNKINKV